jgi:hypothetical protein
MRFYNQQHRFYCGVDLHARSMYRYILDQAGQAVLPAPAQPADPIHKLKASSTQGRPARFGMARAWRR